MHFKQIRFAVIAIIGVFIYSCESDSDETGISPVQSSAQTIDEINQLLSSIDIQGVLPNGAEIDYDRAAFSTGYNYAINEGFSFTENRPAIVLQGSDFEETYGTVKFSEEDGSSNSLVFRYILKSTFGDLAKEYPELFYSSPETENLTVVIAFSGAEVRVSDWGDLGIFEVNDVYSSINSGSQFIVDSDSVLLSSANISSADGSFYSMFGFFDYQEDFLFAQGDYRISQGEDRRPFQGTFDLDFRYSDKLE